MTSAEYFLPCKVTYSQATEINAFGCHCSAQDVHQLSWWHGSLLERLIWLISYIDFQMFKRTFSLRVTPLGQKGFFYVCCFLFTNHLLQIFVSVFLRNIGLQLYFLVMSWSGFGIGIAWYKDHSFRERIAKNHNLFIFLTRLYKFVLFLPEMVHRPDQRGQLCLEFPLWEDFSQKFYFF